MYLDDDMPPEPQPVVPPIAFTIPENPKPVEELEAVPWTREKWTILQYNPASFASDQLITPDHLAYFRREKKFVRVGERPRLDDAQEQQRVGSGKEVCRLC